MTNKCLFFFFIAFMFSPYKLTSFAQSRSWETPLNFSHSLFYWAFLMAYPWSKLKLAVKKHLIIGDHWEHKTYHKNVSLSRLYCWFPYILIDLTSFIETKLMLPVNKLAHILNLINPKPAWSLGGTNHLMPNNIKIKTGSLYWNI